MRMQRNVSVLTFAPDQEIAHARALDTALDLIQGELDKGSDLDEHRYTELRQARSILHGLRVAFHRQELPPEPLPSSDS